MFSVYHHSVQSILWTVNDRFDLNFFLFFHFLNYVVMHKKEANYPVILTWNTKLSDLLF